MEHDQNIICLYENRTMKYVVLIINRYKFFLNNPGPFHYIMGSEKLIQKESVIRGNHIGECVLGRGPE